MTNVIDLHSYRRQREERIRYARFLEEQLAEYEERVEGHLPSRFADEARKGE